MTHFSLWMACTLVYERLYSFLCFPFRPSPPSPSLHQSPLSGLWLLLRWLSRNDGLCLGINEDSIHSLDTKHAAPPFLFINLLFFSFLPLPALRPYFFLAPSPLSLLPVISIFTVLTACPFASPLRSLIRRHQYASCHHTPVTFCCFIVQLVRCVCVCVCVSVCVLSFKHIHEGNKHCCLRLNRVSKLYYSQKHKAITRRQNGNIAQPSSYTRTFPSR